MIKTIQLGSNLPRRLAEGPNGLTNRRIEYLADFRKKDHGLKIDDYLIKAGTRIGSKDEMFRGETFSIDIYTHPNQVIALVGYDVYREYEGIENVPVIGQMQAIATRFFDARDLLKPLKWERMLVQILCDEAKKDKHTKIVIEPAEKQHFYKERYMEGTQIGNEIYIDDLEAHQARMRMRYNVTAERSGFKFDDTRRIYIKDL